MSFVITEHAIERFREHIAEATEATVLHYLAGAETIEHTMVAALTQSPNRAANVHKVMFYLSKTKADHWGIFVVESQRYVKTYLRLGASQIHAYWADTFDFNLPESAAQALSFLAPDDERWETVIQAGPYEVALRRPEGVRYAWVVRLPQVSHHALAMFDSPYPNLAVRMLLTTLRALPMELRHRPPETP